MDPCKKILTEYLKCISKYSNTNICRFILNDYNECILDTGKYVKRTPDSLDIIKTYK